MNTELVYHPTLKELKNKEVARLAKRLKGKSDKETLANILEWQDKNIYFWTERWPLASWSLIISLGFLLILCVTWAVFTLFHPINPVIYSTATIYLIKNLVILTFGMFLSAFIGIVMLLIWNTHIFSLEDKNKAATLFRFVWYSLQPSLPVEKVLKYKLGVCRDYAKLTACLLSNLYRRNKIYFAFSPGHVATGIKIKNKIYMLDQHLPIWSLEHWGSSYNKKKTEYKLMNFKDGKPCPIKQPQLASHKIKTSVNTVELSKDAMRVLNLKQSNGRISYKERIPLRKTTSERYEDDDIIRYSFSRALRNKIYNELPGKVNAIKRINVRLEKGVIVLYAYLGRTPRRPRPLI